MGVAEGGGAAVQYDPARIRFLANREVRVIPAGWQHPVDAARHPLPLLPEEMPEVGGGESAIMAYETVTEGTPISPAFPNTREGRLDLVRWCADHCTTLGQHRAGAEAWAAILFGEGTTIALDGTVET